MGRLLNRLLTKCMHRKRMDSRNLLHSEWNRRLGICSLVSIALSLTVTIIYYIILPTLMTNSIQQKNITPYPPPPLIAFFIASFVIFLAGYQLAWISRRVPKNCTLYNFAYATQCQIVAFGVAWSQFLDGIVLIVILAHVYVNHFNLLFKGTIQPSPSFISPSFISQQIQNSTAQKIILNNLKTVMRQSRPTSLSSASSLSLYATQQIAKTSPILTDPSKLAEESINIFYILIIIIAGVLLLFSLRVLITITIVFMIAALFTSASTTIVALLHNIANLHINNIFDDLQQNFNETFVNIQWFLVGFLSIECMSYLADECEKPRKMLSTTTKCFTKFSFCSTLVVFFSFFPFVYRMTAFHNFQPVPLVFNSIKILSARYLMNIGSICALTAALPCSFLPSTRLLCALGSDSLLPLSNHLRRLNGKAGSPRLSVVIVAFIAIGVIIWVPRAVLMEFLPLNLCIRLFLMALIVYKRIFANNERLNDVYDEAKYNLMQSIGGENLSESDSENNSDSDIEYYSSNNESHLLDRIFRLANSDTTNSETGLLEKFTIPPGQVATENHNVLNSSCQGQKQSNIPKTTVVHTHNCFRSPCTSNYQLAGKSLKNNKNNDEKINQQSEQQYSHYSRFHIYDTTNITLHLSKYNNLATNYQQWHQQPAAYLDTENVEKSAQRHLVVFCTLSALVAISFRILWQTTEFVPILALLSCIIGLVASFVIAFNVYRLSPDTDDEINFKVPTVGGGAYGSYTTYLNETENSMFAENGRSNRWRSVGCLASIFTTIQILFQFSINNYLRWLLYMTIGLIIYLTNTCFRRKRR